MNLQNPDSFVVFPTTNSIYPTIISLENLLMQLKNKRGNNISKAFYCESERKLSIHFYQTEKDVDRLINDIDGDSHFSFVIEQTTVVRVIESVTHLLKWLSKMDKHNYKAKLSIDEGRMLVNIEEVNLDSNPDAKQEKLLLIDGSNLLHIGYFATRANALKNSQGIYTNGVFIFVRTFLNLLKQLRPTHLAICWDKEGSNTFRKSLYPDYKAHRGKKDEALIQQLLTTKELLGKMNIMQFESSQYEADDLIGTLSQKWSGEKNTRCYIVSNDHDLYQLLDKNVIQVAQKKGQIHSFSHEHFKNEYGIQTTQWIDVKALLGDTSDNIPGVKGVGEKAAIPLIEKYGTIEHLYNQLDDIQESEFKRYYYALSYGKERAFLSKTLATIVTNVPDVMNVNFKSLILNVDKKSMLLEFQRLQFDTILQQIKRGAYRISS